ncbi:hypothetical protein DUI87_06508 [Hirundo rustica rustica]|uniref:Uncharacterized protein n=1 Tax=Hirundo rustica rustica TaxID=333673 RepID=A0A3M0KV48_HIRRU|nr:hypothetical protein DUI87_06508 [Hirundo rustica rustica]
MDAQDSQPEADGQQKSSIYRVAEAVTDPGVTPDLVTTTTKMTPPSTLHIPKIECSSNLGTTAGLCNKTACKAGIELMQIYTCLTACREFASFHGFSQKPASNYVLTFCFYHSEFERSQKGEELRNTHDSSHKHFPTFTRFCNTSKTDMPSLEGP